MAGQVPPVCLHPGKTMEAVGVRGSPRIHPLPPPRVAFTVNKAHRELVVAGGQLGRKAESAWAVPPSRHTPSARDTLAWRPSSRPPRPHVAQALVHMAAWEGERQRSWQRPGNVSSARRADPRKAEHVGSGLRLGHRTGRCAQGGVAGACGAARILRGAAAHRVAGAPRVWCRRATYRVTIGRRRIRGSRGWQICGVSSACAGASLNACPRQKLHLGDAWRPVGAHRCRIVWTFSGAARGAAGCLAGPLYGSAGLA